jgi:hypothetical protein
MHQTAIPCLHYTLMRFIVKLFSEVIIRMAFSRLACGRVLANVHHGGDGEHRGRGVSAASPGVSVIKLFSFVVEQIWHNRSSSNRPRKDFGLICFLSRSHKLNINSHFLSSSIDI